MIADSATKPTMADDHPSKKTSQSPEIHEGSKDFVYHQTIISPRVSAEDEKLSDLATRVLSDKMQSEVFQQEESGREKLFRYWKEAAGSVCVPEKWGQEAFLKDWADCSLFDAFLVPKGVVSARKALVAEGKREDS